MRVRTLAPRQNKVAGRGLVSNRRRGLAVADDPVSMFLFASLSLAEPSVQFFFFDRLAHGALYSAELLLAGGT